MTRTLFALPLLLAVLCPQYARAQTPDTPQTPNAALREKAFQLLESVAGQLGSLQSAENRARLGANIADSLWIHDEKRARALFALVEQDIRAGLANRDQDEKDSQTLRVFLKLRVDTIERIAKYDGELALAFLQATKFYSDRPMVAVTQSEHGLELRLAKQMVNSNPDLAVKLARKSLGEGFSEELLRLLRQLNKKHQEQALVLYKEVVQKLRDADLLKNWEARRFARDLVRTFRPPTNDNSTFRELVRLFITRALENGCGNKATPEEVQADFCRSAATILPHLERIDPRAVQLKRWISEDLLNIDIQPEAVAEFFDVWEEGSIDDLLALAARHPQMAPQIHVDAVRKTTRLGDFEKARKLATTLIADPEMKQMLLAQIEGAQSARLFDDKRLAEMQARLDTLPQNRHGILVLLSYVIQLDGKNPDAAFKFLKLASDIADSMKPGKEQAESQIRLAMMYCYEKSDRGFEIMESLVPKLNELVDAAVKLDGYETSYVRDGEWNMSAEGNVGALLTTLSQHAGPFAWRDFDRAVNVAAQFNRSEIRLMAHVKLAQAILAGPPQRIRSPYDSYY